MLKKRLFLVSILVVTAITSVWLYWLYLSPPQAFPKQSQLVTEMNRVFPEAKVQEIQASLHLDKRHTFVPFISESGDYGASYWQWQKHKWEVIFIQTKGEPRVWEIDSDDPSTFYFVWNGDPKSQWDYVNFYLARERNYGVTDGVAYYFPKLQMVKKVELKGKTYGVLKLTSDWVKAMNSLEKETFKPGMFDFFGGVSSQQSYFGYIPYTKDNKEADIMDSVNGNSYLISDTQIDFVSILDESEIEVPKGN